MSAKATQRAPDSRGFPHGNNGSRLSIDPDHHVTEAIGDMYGDYLDESGNRYSFISNPNRLSSASTLTVPVRNGAGGVAVGGPAAGASTAPQSPTLTIRPASPSLGTLTEMDYESDPVAVAQEISNLQALRRMSMDVTSAADPDLPSFNSFVPSTPPDDNGDPGSVFWVPARLHPELAPQEFSAYLEAKKNEIRRPTRDGSLAPDGGNMSPGLRRKKSMLSRQIDSTEGLRQYQDGAERLGKKNSLNGGRPPVELDELMKDPSALMQKLSVDSRRTMEEGDDEQDMPIIQAPKGGLKRSTATHYRKGSLRRGERVGSVRRLAAAARAFADGSPGHEESPPSPNASGFKLDRVSTEPMSLPSHSKDDLQPQKSVKPSVSHEDLAQRSDSSQSQSVPISDRHKSVPAKSRRPTSPKARSRASEPVPPVPRIVETPPPPPNDIPERHSSISSTVSEPLKKRPPITRTDTGSRTDTDPYKDRDVVPELKVKKRPESTSTSTKSDRKTSWGWLPGYSAEKEEQKAREKEEKQKAKKEKRPKSGEKVLKGAEDKDKKPRAAKADPSPNKTEEKRPKSAEKYDNTRLDVLQKSIEMGNAGKVVAADPSAQKVDDKEARKSRTEDKKDSIFAFFGGSRKKSGEHGGRGDKKGGSSRGTSPDPPHEKKPQQDYYYARFPIHIERAIYRLSHLKLANPRRPLHQQVLLSNFMYSYLAKVQQTQPHLVQQATASPQQQQQQRQQQQQQQQQQAQEQSGQYYYEDNEQAHNDYVDDSQMYDTYDDDDDHSRQAQYQHQQENDYSDSGGSDPAASYYHQQQQPRGRSDTNDDGDMW